MSGTILVVWLLVGFNTLVVAGYVYRRARNKPPLLGPVSVVTQGGFVAVNCMFLFQEEAQHYVNWLTTLY